MNSRSKNTFTFIAAAIVVCVAAFVFLWRPNAATTTAADTGGADNAPAVESAHASFGPFVVKVQAEGHIGGPAGSQAKIAFAEPGVIALVRVNVGDTVTAGQALGELDTSGLAIDAASARADAAAAQASYGGGSVPRAAVASAQAKLLVAQARLRADERQNGTANSDASAALAALRQAEGKVSSDQRGLDRAQQTYAAGVSALKDVEAARAQLRSDQADLNAAQSRASSAQSGISGARVQAQADFSQAVTDVRNAQAQIGVSSAQAQSAQAKYAQTQHALDKAVLRAPSDGVIEQIFKHVGESVDTTQPVFAIGRSSGHVVTVTVSGTDSNLIRVGDPVTVVEPLRNTRAEGTVTAVVKSVDPTTQGATVIVSAVPPGGANGDAVTATINVATRHGVIVPATAVVTDPQSGKTLVFVKAASNKGDSKYASREVVISASNNTQALIGKGLRNGEVVATQGAVDLLAPSGGG